MDERIAKLKTPESCEQFAINVEKMGLPDLALAARRRAIELKAAQHGAETAAERELRALIHHAHILRGSPNVAAIQGWLDHTLPPNK